MVYGYSKDRRYCHARTMTALAEAAFLMLLDDPYPDAVLNIESHKFNVVLMCDDACTNGLDVGKHLWLNRSRWSRLMKEYVPAEGLERFIDQAVEILSGEARDGATANLMFRDPDRYEKKHRWGGCIMGATFRAGPRGKPACLTFFSRTTYIGYMGFLDMAIATCIARAIREKYRQDGTPEGCIDISPMPLINFRWYITSMQLHCFKSIPYILTQAPLLKRVMNPNLACPTQGNIAKWYDKILAHYKQWGVKMLDHEKYGPFRRIKRRWLEHKRYITKNIPPSLMVHELTFEKCI